MVKKAPKKKAKKAKKSAAHGKVFSLVGLHTQLTKTLTRLNAQTKTAKRDELIKLVKQMQADSDCPQDMLIDLGV